MRLPYASATPSEDPKEQEIYARVQARRAPRPLQPLDLTLLHAPSVIDGYNAFLGAIRTSTSLSDSIREIAICRVAVCNGAVYEWEHHAVLAKKAGLTGKQMGVLALERFEGPQEKKLGEVLGEKEAAVVRYTDAMTREVRVGDEVFAEVRKWFSDKEIVELTATVGACLCDGKEWER
jgi:alkylhydroperoxidase family enzyme